MFQHHWKPGDIRDMDITDFVFAVQHTERINKRHDDQINTD